MTRIHVIGYTPHKDVGVLDAWWDIRPVLELLENGKAVLRADARFCVDFDNGVLGTYTIKEGYECDSASIPFLARIFFSKYLACNAGIAHDFLYWIGVVLTRLQADRVFFFLSRKVNIRNNTYLFAARHFIFHTIGCRLGYFAVRLFGWQFFNKNGAKK